MSFGIKLGHTDCLRRLDVSDSTLTEAIQTVFPLEGHAVLEWDGLGFQINYKYDLSMMMEDLLYLLRIDPKSGGEALKMRGANPDILRQRGSIPPDGA